MLLALLQPKQPAFAAGQPSGRQIRGRCRVVQPPSAFLNLFRGKQSTKQQAPARPPAVEQLLAAIEGTERGLATSKQQREEILAAAAELEAAGADSSTTGVAELSATWKLVWTTGELAVS